MANRLLRTSLTCEVRGIDEEKRQATFVASTERAVSVGPWEPEVLRMKGARLARYQKNPVVLDSHSRWSLQSVIGSSETVVEGRKLVSTVTYATNEAGENAWQLVRGGHVRAMSIGYTVNEKKVRRLREGETDGEGDAKVSGPASIVDDWELLEVSNVPVPADEDAVRRTFFSTIKPGARKPSERKHVMAKPNPQNKRKGVDYLALALDLAAAGAQRAEGDAEDAAADDSSEESEPRAEGEVTCPECGHEFTPERAEDDMAGDEGEPRAEEPSEEPKGEKAKAHAKAAVRRAPVVTLSKREQLKRDVYAITPRGLEGIAGQCLLDGKTLDETRAELKKAWAARHTPLGTPEAGEIERQDKKNAEGGRELSDDVLLRSLESLTD